MQVKRMSYAVCDTKYHLVWAPKYRRWIIRGNVRRRVEPVLLKVAEDFGFELVEWEVAKEPVHVLLNFPPRYSIAKVVGIVKSISARQVFRAYPELKKHLRKQEFWEDGYVVWTAGEAVTAAVVPRYIQYHRQEEHEVEQLKLC